MKRNLARLLNDLMNLSTSDFGTAQDSVISWNASFLNKWNRYLLLCPLNWSHSRSKEYIPNALDNVDQRARLVFSGLGLVLNDFIVNNSHRYAIFYYVKLDLNWEFFIFHFSFLKRDWCLKLIWYFGSNYF